MNSYKHLKNVLFHNIKNLSDVCSIFCVNPDTDFTRNRMLDFETTMKIVLCMGASPIKDWYYVKKKCQLNRNFFYLTSTFEKC